MSTSLFASKRCRFLLHLAVSAGSVLGAADAVQAQVTRTWTNLGGGPAGNASNWLPAGVPAPGDDLTFNLPFAYAVTFGAAVPETHWLLVQQGAVSFSFPTAHTNTYGFRVYGGAGAEFTNGSFTGPSLLVPYSPGYPGAAAVEISGPSTSLTLGVGPGFVESGLVVSDNGTVLIQDGADVTTTYCIVGDSNTTASPPNRPSLLRVTGSGTTLDVTSTSGLRVTEVGNISQVCTLEVLSGATMSCDNLWLGRRDAATANVTCSGSSTLTVRDDVTMGNASGNGAVNVTISANASMSVLGRILEQDGDNTNGTFNVSGTLDAGAIRSNNSDLNVLDDGTLRINALQGGATVLRVDKILVNASATGQVPDLILDGNDFVDLNVQCDSIVIGNDRAGNLDVRDGVFNFASNDVRLGDLPGGNGTLLVRPAGEMRFNDGAALRVGAGGVGSAVVNGVIGRDQQGNINVGSDGIGTLDVSGDLDIQFLQVGSPGIDPGSLGTATLTGSGSNSRIFAGAIGGDFGSPLSTLSLDLGALLEVVNATPGEQQLSYLSVEQSGRVFVNSSTIDASQNATYQGGILLRGLMQLDNATISGNVEMRANPNPNWPLINGSGTIDGRVTTITESVIQNSTGGLLRLGPSGGGTYVFTNNGRIRSTNGSTITVRCLSAINQPGATIELDNGTVTVNSQPTTTLTNNGDILGNGVLNADLINNGFITPLTGASFDGIQFTGDVSQSASRSMQGSRIWFGPTSTFTGAGSINANVLIDTGSVIDAVGGTLNLGNTVSPFGAEVRGAIRCNGNLVRLRDSNNVVVTSTGVLNLNTNGSLEAPTGLSLGSGSSLRGSGTVTGLVSSFGRVAPTGTISIIGNYVQSAAGPLAGQLEMDIAGTGSGQFDLLAVTGNATLNGVLQVTLAPTYTPSLGDTVVLLTATGTRTGTFSHVVLNNNPPGVQWTLDYLSNSVRVRVIAAGPVCDDIDVNNDTSLFDPTDVDAFLSVFSEGPCIPANATCNDVDFNNDGSLFDPCDIDSFLLVFSEGPCTLCGV